MATLRDSFDAVSEARPPLSLAAFLVLVVRCCVMGMGHGGGGDAKEVGWWSDESRIRLKSTDRDS